MRGIGEEKKGKSRRWRKSRRREMGKGKRWTRFEGLLTGDEEIERQEKRERWQRSAAGR